MRRLANLAVVLLLSGCATAGSTPPVQLTRSEVRWCTVNADQMFDAYVRSDAPTIEGDDVRALFLMLSNLTDDAQILGPSPGLREAPDLTSEQVNAVREVCRAAYEEAGSPPQDE